MGKSNKNTTSYKKTAMVGYRKTEESEKIEKPKLRPKKKTVIIASVSALLVCVTVALSLIFLFDSSGFDYMKSDLSEYISLSEDDYRDFSLEIKFDTVDESDVDRKIMGLLYQHKSEEALDKGAEQSKVPVSIGDTVYIYYRGYTVDENGREAEFAGGFNVMERYHTLGIGSLSFINGFEEGLIGAVPWEHYYNPQTDLIKSGAVQTGDAIYLSYSVMLPDGKTATKISERIDLSKDNINAFYGEGFKEYFESSNIEIGNEIVGQKTFSYGDGTAVYFDMKVDYAIRCANKPITVDAQFPADYRDKSLRGAKVKFDVYFKSSVVYDVPEYNEQFITETLKMTEEQLGKYEGKTFLEKHRAYLYEEAVSENQSIRESLTEEYIWEYLDEKADVKSLPLSEVESVYNEIYAEIYNQYSTYYSAIYPTIESYIIAKYGADQNADAKSLMVADAESIVTEKLIFYYIIRKEKLIPSKEEYKSSYDKIYSEHLDYYLDGIYSEQLSKLETEAEKQKLIEKIEGEMLDYFGEEYFKELVYYDYAYDKIISFATVIEK